MSKQQKLLWGIGGLVVVLGGLLPVLHHLSEGLLTFGVMGIGGAVVTLRMLPHWKRPLSVDTRQVSQEQMFKALARTETLITDLEALAGEDAQVWPPRLAQIRKDNERETLRLVVLGNPAVGKSAIATHLSQALTSPIQLTESEQLVTLPPDQTSAIGIPTIDDLTAPVDTADLVMFVIQGDLTDSEYQCLQTLNRHQKNTLVVFNKQDQYLPSQRSLLQQKLDERLQGDSVAWVAIAAAPHPIKVRRVQSDNSVQEAMETPEPEVAALIQSVEKTLTEDAQQLIRQQTFQQTLALQGQIQGQLNTVRHQQSLPVIERYQWMTAGAAFANPVPTLDMLAAAAISTKMVLDLGKLYQLQFSAAQAQAVATTLATALLKFGCVEVATQAITGLLKGHMVTYVAGGILQGASAAHLTRVAGLTLVEHFQYLSAAQIVNPESNWNPEKLRQTVAVVFQAQQQLKGLRGTVEQAIQKLQAPSSSAHVAAH